MATKKDIPDAHEYRIYCLDNREEPISVTLNIMKHMRRRLDANQIGLILETPNFMSLYTSWPSAEVKDLQQKVLDKHGQSIVDAELIE